MDITSKIRAARASLDWTREDLASRADLTEKTIANLEGGVGEPNSRTMGRVIMAFEKENVFFTPFGIEQRKNAVFEFSGREGLKSWMEMVYQHCLNHPRDRVLVNNIRQAKYNELAGDFLMENRTRLAAIKDMKPWRVLLHEDDVNVNSPPYADIRYVPDTQFGSVGQYCFGRYLGIVDFEDGCKITVIENQKLKDTWAEVYSLLWRDAKIVGTQ